MYSESTINGLKSIRECLQQLEVQMFPYRMDILGLFSRFKKQFDGLFIDDLPLWQIREKAKASVLNETFCNNEIINPVQHALKIIDDILGKIQNSEPNKSFANHFSSLILLREFDLSDNPRLGDIFFAFRFIANAKKELHIFFQESPAAPTQQNKKIFLVHGHDVVSKERVARFVSNLDLEVIILQEAPNSGATIIEKFERESNVGFAIILLTKDDLGEARAILEKQSDDKLFSLLKCRARQNVVLELGYFIGKLGRKRVCALTQNGIELPSDILGVGYLNFDEGGAWKLELAKELQAAGYLISGDKLFR